MRAHAGSKLHDEAQRVEATLRSFMFSAGSLLLTILTILILYFGVFAIRTH